MICPNCKKTMEALTAHSHYDAHVEIDQCPNCGGLWFDGSELFTIKQGLAEIIDKVDRMKLRTLVPAAAEMHCPRDGAHLALFKDRSFPESIQVESCPDCNGFFFNRGEFRGWQTARAEKMKADSEADKKFDKDIASLIALYSAGGEESLNRLGNFLAAAYGQPGGLPVKREDPEIERAAKVVGFVQDLIGLFKKPADGPKTKEEEREGILAKAVIFNTALKILAFGATAYFIISEARAVTGTKLIFNELDIYIWYFRMLMSLFVLPVFYAFKFINFIGNKYFPEVKAGVINSTFFQAKMFYYVVYGILFLLFISKLFN